MHIKHKHKDKYKPENYEQDDNDDYSATSEDEMNNDENEDSVKVDESKTNESKENLKTLVKEISNTKDTEERLVNIVICFK